MQLYLVPCTCGEQLRVRTSQAGEQITCRCGATVSVPTIRGMKQLRMVEDEVEQTSTAPMWQGPAFAVGVLALFAGALVLAFNALLVPTVLHVDVNKVGMTEADVKRAAIPAAELKIDELYDEFVALRDRGRNDHSILVQGEVAQARRNRDQRQTTGLGLTGVGLLLTIAGLAPLLMKKR